MEDYDVLCIGSVHNEICQQILENIPEKTITKESFDELFSEMYPKSTKIAIFGYKSRIEYLKRNIILNKYSTVSLCVNRNIDISEYMILIDKLVANIMNGVIPVESFQNHLLEMQSDICKDKKISYDDACFAYALVDLLSHSYSFWSGYYIEQKSKVMDVGRMFGAILADMHYYAYCCGDGMMEGHPYIYIREGCAEGAAYSSLHYYLFGKPLIPVWVKK